MEDEKKSHRKKINKTILKNNSSQSEKNYEGIKKVEILIKKN